MTSHVLALAALAAAAALPASAHAQTYGAPGAGAGAATGPTLLQNQTSAPATRPYSQGFGLSNGRPGDTARASDQGFGARGVASPGSNGQAAGGFGGASGYGARGAIDLDTGRRVYGGPTLANGGANAPGATLRVDNRTPLAPESAPPSTIPYIPPLVPTLAPPQISLTKPFRR